MVAILEVRNRILSINLRNYNIKLDARLNEWIMKLAPDLVVLRLKDISTPVSPDFFPCLQTLGITLTNSSLSPIIYPTNCSIKKLIIENQTSLFLPVYNLLQKFRKIDHIDFVKCIITLDLLYYIQRFSLVAVSFSLCIEAMRNIDILSILPTLEYLSIFDRHDSKYELLKGLTRHFEFFGEHRLVHLKYVVRKKSMKELKFPSEFDFGSLRNFSVCFLTNEKYDGDEFIDLFYYFPYYVNLTFIEIRSSTASQDDIDRMEVLFSALKYKRKYRFMDVARDEQWRV